MYIKPASATATYFQTDKRQKNDAEAELTWGKGVWNEQTPSWVTHDLQVNYHAPWDGRITFGAQNVTGKNGPVSWRALYDWYGRVYYAEYTQTFD